MSYRKRLLDAIDVEQINEDVVREVIDIIDEIEFDVNKIKDNLSGVDIDSLHTISEAFEESESLSKNLY